MTHEATRETLAAFEQAFSRALSIPLRCTRGALEPTPDAYDSALAARLRSHGSVDGRGRLAVLQKMSWLRYFQLAHDLYPLMTGLVGHFGMNLVVLAFLSDHPPSSADISRSLDDLPLYLDRLTQRTPSASPPRISEHFPQILPVHVEAARVDAAFHRALFGSDEPAWRIEAVTLATLATQKLSLRASVQLLTQHWPLVELRRQALFEGGERPLPLPPVLADPSHWALVPTADGLLEIPLPPVEHRLYQQLGTRTLGAVLDELASEFRALAPTSLAAHVRSAMARAREFGLLRAPGQG